MSARDIGAAVWGLALASVALSAAAQLLMKMGMTKIRALSAGEPAQAALLAAALNPHVLGGLACYGLSAVLWLLVLSRMPLSMAYPLVALAIGAVVTASALMLGEQVSAIRAAGVLLIMVGVALIGRS